MDPFTQHLAMSGDFIKPHHPAATREEDNVTYYRVDFVTAKFISRPAKRFVSEEKAKQHAKRVLGVADDSVLFSKVAIVPVSKDGTRV
jgi:hypothetical protein